jgi:hypothetical protein
MKMFKLLIAAFNKLLRLFIKDLRFEFEIVVRNVNFCFLPTIDIVTNRFSRDKWHDGNSYYLQLSWGKYVIIISLTHFKTIL